MQYNQPLGPYNNQSFHQFPTYNSVPLSFPITPTPTENIVGEGDIIPAHNAFGSIQFYFIPRNTYINARHCLCHSQPCFCSSWNPSGPGQVNVWIVRSFANQFAPNMMGQNLAQTYLNPQQNTWNNSMTMQRPQHIIFHRDGVTSTTDLHYFFPLLRSSPWAPRPCAGVQATPTTIDTPVPSCGCNSSKAVQHKTKSRRAKKKKELKKEKSESAMSTCSLCEEMCFDCEEKCCHSCGGPSGNNNAERKKVERKQSFTSCSCSD